MQANGLVGVCARVMTVVTATLNSASRSITHTGHESCLTAQCQCPGGWVSDNAT